MLTRHHLHHAVLVTIAVVVGAAALVLAVEEAAPGTSITTFGDALWWAAATVTTVGYGDVFPRTAAGRGIATFLMLAGIALFGVLIANVASFFLERQVDDQDDRLDEVLRRLDAIEAALRAER